MPVNHRDVLSRLTTRLAHTMRYRRGWRRETTPGQRYQAVNIAERQKFARRAAMAMVLSNMHDPDSSDSEDEVEEFIDFLVANVRGEQLRPKQPYRPMNGPHLNQPPRNFAYYEHVDCEPLFRFKNTPAEPHLRRLFDALQVPPVMRSRYGNRFQGEEGSLEVQRMVKTR